MLDVKEFLEFGYVRFFDKGEEFRVGLKIVNMSVGDINEIPVYGVETFAECREGAYGVQEVGWSADGSDVRDFYILFLGGVEGSGRSEWASSPS